MFIQEYREDTLSLGSIQFAVGIALDSFNEREYAKRVIYMYSKKVMGSLYDDAPFPSRDDLCTYLLQQGNGLIKDYIHYLYTEECLLYNLPSSNGKISATARRRFVSLGEIAGRVNEKELLHEVMNIVLGTITNKFIVLYAHTKIFHIDFQNYLMNNYYYSKDKVRKNTYSEGTVSHILSKFIEYVENYSSSGSYDPDTANPSAFLIKALQFYTYSGEFYEILNEKSQFSNISDNNTLSLASYQKHDLADEVSIDFISLATKINRASYSLYNHANDNGIAYYDIFSWYRDMLATKLYNNNKASLAKAISGIQLKKPTEMIDVESTKRDKGKRRNQLCEVYYEGVKSVMSVADIYPLYYKVGEKSYSLCVHRNSSGGASDGSAYYDWNEIRSKSRLKNEDKFQYDYEGFLALKALVEFIESPSNNTGVNVFNMPVDIFRDKRMLKRFSSFTNYISLYPDVTNLMYEVDNDSVRSVSIDSRRVRNNDSIFDKLLNALTLEKETNKELFDKAFRTALSVGNTSVKDVRDTEVNKLRNAINALNTHWNQESTRMPATTTLQFIQSEVAKYTNAAEKLKYLLQCLLSAQKTLQTCTLPAYRYVLAFYMSNTLTVLVEFLKQPVLNENGIYSLVDVDLKTILQEIGLQEDIQNVILNAYKSSCEIILQDNIVDAEWENMRNLFTCSGVMQNFLNQMLDLVKLLDNSLDNVSNQNNLYLVYAELAALAPILKQKWVINHIQDLHLFFGNGDVLLPLNIGTMTPKQYKSVQLARNEVLVSAMQSYIQLFMKEEFTFINKLNDGIAESLTVAGSVTSEGKLNSSILSRADLYITNVLNTSKYQQVLESFCSFSITNYVIKADKLFNFRNKKEFIHRQGYIVTINHKGDHPFSVVELDDETFDKMHSLYFTEV